MWNISRLAAGCCIERIKSAAPVSVTAASMSGAASGSDMSEDTQDTVITCDACFLSRNGFSCHFVIKRLKLEVGYAS